MTSRLLAAAILVLSMLIAWLTLASALAARALQAVVILSLGYVGYLAWHGWRTMRGGSPPSAAAGGSPSVAIVIPARNEARVIGALIRDLLQQDYAGHASLDVLVVDDGSTDGTADEVRAAAAGSRLVRVVARQERSPATKAGVLSYAEALITSDLLGILDADSRVGPDFVSRVVAAWAAEPSAAAMQIQRRAGNYASGWLAAAQDDELLMDMASQCGRSATDGTAELRGNGMFVRRSVLERVGGWDPEALTEDLELSTRLAAAGERTGLVPGAEIREESVTSIRVLWRQRMRWAEGSMRRLMELGPGLLTSRAVPAGRRLDFLLFTTEFVVPPLFVTTTIASLLTIPLPGRADWTLPASLFAGYGLGTLLLALAGIAASGVRGWRLVGRSLRGSLFLSHWLLVVPAALLRIALLSRTRTFAQTPHHGSGGR
jgi:1,2-diacylglycerol 3-beta-glucosyltransferase